MDYYAGRVHTIVYEDPPNAFYIMVMVLDSTMKGVTVKGHVPGLVVEKGTWFGFEANWVQHAKFGKQLSISRAPVLKNGWNPDTASAMLQTHGVSEFLCDQIRQVFGDDQFLQVLEDPDRLEEVPGVSDVTAAHIVERWQSVVALFKSLEFLNDLGLPRSKVRQVWEVFEDDAIKVLSKNPWALVEVDGIKFDQADEVARKLGLSLDSPDRTRGAVLYTCKTHQDFGHLYMQTGVLFNGVRALVPNADKAVLGKALVELSKEGRIVLDKGTRPGTLAIYDPWYHHLEVESVQGLVVKLEKAKFLGDSLYDYKESLGSVGPDTEAEVEDGSDLDVVVKTAVEEWGRQVRVTLTDKQKQGVVNALLHPVSVLTGLPGTGKTTSLRAVVNVLQDAEVPFLLCAPTGIAAKRLTAVTGAQAYTIHRAFAAKGFSDDIRETLYAGIIGGSKGTTKSSGEGDAWEFGPGRPHPAQVVIIDEASMVDQHLLYRLLTCTSPSCRLVFVGDHAQLPSVGPGNVLGDLIASGQFPVVKLTAIFRQKDTSDIIFAAHDIHAGKVPNIKGSSEFILIQVGSDDDALEVVMKLSQKLFGKQRDFQVLSPRHAGVVGVTNLNARLRELLNPGSPGLSEVKLGNGVVRKGDRVMVVKNNYKLGVFNGDVGEVARINRKDKEVQVEIYGTPPLFVSFPFRDMSRHVRLAYACTVHKAQGLEYDMILMPIMDNFYLQLQRNLLYTAVTRAKQKVILVGTQSALAKAVANDREDLRNTLFPDRLSAVLGGNA